MLAIRSHDLCNALSSAIVSAPDMHRLLPLIALLVFLRPLDVMRGQEERTVVLPPFIVEDASKGPPWRYAQMPGFEILSRCDDGTTRDLA